MLKSMNNKLTVAILASLLSINAHSFNVSNKIDFQNPIVNAAEKNNINLVAESLRKGIHADSRGEFSTTALMRAAKKGNAQIVKLLLHAGADVDLVDLGGTSALHIAAKSGNIEIIEMLIDAGADIESVDENGWTALMRSVSSGHEEAVKHLLSKGAKPTSTNRFGQNSLTLAAQQSEPGMMKIFQTQLNKITKFDKELLINIAKSEKNHSVLKILDHANHSSNKEHQSISNSSIIKDNILTVNNNNRVEISNMEKANFEETTKPMVKIAQNSPENKVKLDLSKLNPNLIKNDSELKKRLKIKNPVNTKGKITTITEAVRVPLSEIEKPTSKKTKFIISKKRPGKEIARYEPSSSSIPRKSFWLETILFKNIIHAQKAYNRVKMLPEFTNLRVRMIKPLSHRYSQATSIRVGPIYDQYMSARVCKLLMGDIKSCKIIRDLKKSTANLRKKKLTKNQLNSNYDNKYSNKFWVQFGSFSNEKNAEFQLRYLKKKFNHLSSNKNFIVTMPRNSSKKEQSYRLRLGSFNSSKEAGKKCTNFRNKGIQCIIVRG